jgi:hypothetical protein
MNNFSFQKKKKEWSQKSRNVVDTFDCCHLNQTRPGPKHQPCYQAQAQAGPSGLVGTK